jgi:hypothetical protein
MQFFPEHLPVKIAENNAYVFKNAESFVPPILVATLRLWV